jgi:hypothetical protein
MRQRSDALFVSGDPPLQFPARAACPLGGSPRRPGNLFGA